ncbi:hypothetical protein CP97_14833 [Aurantiacibacter atlanticus]|uniref:Uncharacterized protein n=1 Tax=Aurantiacibacter atlanticus TaxID=1648404 RepID=A0A161J4F4_9SPHN|nr:hypothetical protein CP97_14833 [Aurantiacibacter atlanticus]
MMGLGLLQANTGSDCVKKELAGAGRFEAGLHNHSTGTVISLLLGLGNLFFS